VSRTQDARDWYIMIHVSVFGFGILSYAFFHPSAGVFATACGTLTTVIGMYHWFTIRDDKTPDV
jgi:hypothetical protein